MTKTAEFGQPAARVPQPGTCRICGCVEDQACLVEAADTQTGLRPCGWADHTKTLCDAPDCITAAKKEIGVS
jgi:hypothetical protein